MKGIETVPVLRFLSSLFKRIEKDNTCNGCNALNFVKDHIKKECEDPQGALQQTLAS